MIYKTIVKRASIIFCAGILVYACANKAQGPTGGPKDITPPRVLRSIPENGSINFSKKQIQVDFDEIISIDKPAENVIISPPQVTPPDVKSYGKRLSVDFNEDLLDSTTYSINFGNAIVDLNEKNALKNYVFAFSTGNEIDTLKIGGTVIDAENLNPLPGIFVGIYKEKDDSVFSKKPFLRIGKTDENGRFSIDNVKKGAYKVFALGDANHDYYFQPGEGLALYDSLVVPTSRIEEMHDTVWKDSITVDSIRYFMGTHFLPDDVTLRYFKESKKRQYFLKAERKDQHAFSLYFNTTATQLPEIKPLNFEWEGKYILQKNNTLDSLTYWITDPKVWETDTLQMTMTYLKTDSLFHLNPVTDTLNVSMRKIRINPKAKSAKKGSPDTETKVFKFTNNVAPTFELYNPIVLRFETPLSELDISKIKLSQLIDTTYKSIPFKWHQLDSTKMSYSIDYKWVPEMSYEIAIDSAAFKSIYDDISNSFISKFKIRSLEEYSSVKLILANHNPKSVLQILDTKDNVLQSKPALEKGTRFEYLKPGDYYVRMFIDENGNGKWDVGDLTTRRQPEEVYYYPKKLSLMANWEFEETWDYLQVPLLQQKPIELIKATSTKKQ
ncbi:MAG: Ig-like domain-containing protein [Paludibacter sp.]